MIFSIRAKKIMYMTYSFVAMFQRREEGTAEESTVYYHQKKVQFSPPLPHTHIHPPTHTLVARVIT